MLKCLSAALVLAACLFGLTACSESSKGGGGGSKLPTIPSIHWRFNGGDALTGAATNGGDGGGILLAAVNDVLLDDNRTRPTVSTNFLSSAALDDGVVTYAELEGLLAPAIAGGVATFSLPAGSGFLLPSGTTLDLSDAPVDGVAILTDSNIVLQGNVVLTRTTTDSVTLELETSSGSTTSMLVTGRFDGRGSATRNGGSVRLATTGTNSGIIFLATGDFSGGAGDAATDAGHAGVLYVESAGDLILRHFGVEGKGGSGSDAGGNGGGILMQVGNDMLAPFRWGGDFRGGNGNSGDAGDGGIAQIIGFQWSAAKLNSRFVVKGGDSIDGNGGTGGDAVVAVYSTSGIMTGALYVIADGGSSENGDGGSAYGGLSGCVAATLENFQYVYEGSGGSGVHGGNAGASTMRGHNMTKARHTATVRGGFGEVNGGFGGEADVQQLAVGPTATWDGVRLSVKAEGGVGELGNGGNGGAAYFISSTGSSTAVTGADFNASTNGGTGANGGNGGYAAVIGFDGLFEGEFRFNADGGAATGSDGGFGGVLMLDLFESECSLLIRANLRGADGVGSGIGGGGGSSYFYNDGAGAMVTKGDIVIQADGGNAQDGVAGSAWEHEFNTGEGGPSVFSRFTINASAGSSAGSDGGLTAYVAVIVGGELTLNNASIAMNGGSGATQGGNGSGGYGGFFYMETEDSLITYNGSLSANGGSAAGAGFGGEGGFGWIELDINGDGSAGSLTWNGAVNLRGGAAAGNGNGGAGGMLLAWDSGATSGGRITASGTWNLSGGNSATMQGGDGGMMALVGRGNMAFNASANMSGGNGNIGGNGGFGGMDTLANLTYNGSMTANGGAGAAVGGSGGDLIVGADNPTEVTLTSNARLRANGGATTGAAGFITIDPNGAGPNNPALIESGSAVVETRDGDGTDQSATNVVRD